jgi:hypothetical protein
VGGPACYIREGGGYLAKLPGLTGTLGLTGMIGVDLGRRSPIERLSGPMSGAWRRGSRAQRRTADAERRLAGGEPKMASRPPFFTGRKKERGGHEDLTRGLGQEEDTPEKEIGAAAELWLGLFGAAALQGEGEGGRARERCRVDRGLGVPFIGPRGEGGRTRKAVGRGRWPAP